MEKETSLCWNNNITTGFSNVIFGFLKFYGRLDTFSDYDYYGYSSNSGGIMTIIKRKWLISLCGGISLVLAWLPWIIMDFRSGIYFLWIPLIVGVRAVILIYIAKGFLLKNMEWQHVGINRFDHITNRFTISFMKHNISN